MNIIEDLKISLIAYYDGFISLLPRIGLGIAVCLILLIILKTSQKKLIQFLTEKADDRLLINFINNVIPIAIWIIVILLFLYIIGLDGITKSVLGTAGVSAIVIGFAFKDIAENFLAGVIMAFNRPFRMGDTIKTGDVEGNIIEMSLRDTHLKTFDGKDVYVPNGQILKNPLFNYTIDGFLRKEFTIGVDYDSDIKLVRKIIMDELLKFPGIINDKKPPATFIGELTASTINIRVQYWIDTFNKKFSVAETQTNAIDNILTKLTEADINMPGDILEIKRYKKA